MKPLIIKTVVKTLREKADMIDAGNSELTESEAMDIMSVLCHHAMSKYDACRYLNLSRSRFDDLVRENKLPKGKQRAGFKEKIWYQDELDACTKKLKGH
jgi:hypothetical protein